MTQTPPTRLDPTRVVAARVKALRSKRGWSAQRLADELTKVGIPWDRSIVANFENHRRQTVGVEELLGLAYVLDVAPIHLLVPPADDQVFYGVTPEMAIPLREARAWIRGREPAIGQDPRSYFAEVPDQDADPAPLTPAEIAGESARIQYHRRNAHLFRDGSISAGEYFHKASEAEWSARRAAGGTDG